MGVDNYNFSSQVGVDNYNLSIIPSFALHLLMSYMYIGQTELIPHKLAQVHFNDRLRQLTRLVLVSPWQQ